MQQPEGRAGPREGRARPRRPSAAGRCRARDMPGLPPGPRRRAEFPWPRAVRARRGLHAAPPGPVTAITPRRGPPPCPIPVPRPAERSPPPAYATRAVHGLQGGYKENVGACVRPPGPSRGPASRGRPAGPRPSRGRSTVRARRGFWPGSPSHTVATADRDRWASCRVPSLAVPSPDISERGSASGLDARTMPATATPADASSSRRMALRRPARAVHQQGRPRGGREEEVRSIG
ncbi:hypothetical protein PAHAL_5G131300 [Panicum hallii]|uniref:Uncharacterized protein n=1 Tax=Panicum hallii TaxID=206008 RepID=A0A2T8IJU7_9POAL|nr:hypothetical protein PAHAL_5G131300 [Panicum hallii]